MILCGKGCHNLYVSSSRLETPNVNAICCENGFSLSEASEKKVLLVLTCDTALNSSIRNTHKYADYYHKYQVKL